jgi:hypothetical protein
MDSLNTKLTQLAQKVRGDEEVRIAIFGLGSVGHYLLEYLLQLDDPQLKLFVVGRNHEKLARNLNISRVAGLIRGQPGAEIEAVEADFNSVDSTAAAIGEIQPDFIVNSSRAYSGIKYGGISWGTVRAYGLWASLSVKYVKVVMEAVAQSARQPIVINTSYADATNAWLKSADMAYPDFGSGNLNHLVPRIKLAVARLLGLSAGDIQQIQVTLATSHFHDLAISREGTTEGVEPLLEVRYRDERIEIDRPTLYRDCAIEMPVDQKRNMMNASSNFEIIVRILRAIRTATPQLLHIPGFDGLLGGYPVVVESDDDSAALRAVVSESAFSLDEMVEHNRESIALDGVADVRDGRLWYTPQLVEKVRRAFAFELPSSVQLEASDEVAAELIEKVISKHA